MKLRLFAYLLFAFYILSTASAQTTATPVSTTPPPDKAITSDNFSVMVENINNGIRATNIKAAVFASPFPFTNDNLASQIEGINGRHVADKEITDTELELKKISLYLDDEKSKLSKLQANKQQTDTLQKQIEATLVILQNPHNQLNLTNEETTELAALSDKVKIWQSNIGKRIGEIQSNIQSANNALGMANQYLVALKDQSQQQKNRDSQDSISNEEDHLKNELLGYENRINEIRIKLGPSTKYLDLTERRQLNDELLYLEEMVWLKNLDKKLTDNYIAYGNFLGQQDSLANDSTKVLSNGYQAIQDAITVLTQKKTELEGRQKTYDGRADKDLAKYDLTDAYAERVKNIDAQKAELQHSLPMISKLISDKRRESLYRIDPLYKVENLKTGLSEIQKSPQFFYYQIKISLTALFKGILAKLPIYAMVTVLVFSFFYFLNKWLKKYLLEHNAANSDAVFFYQNAQKLVEFIQMGCFKYGSLTLFALLIFLTHLATPSKEILYAWVALLAGLIYWFDITNISLEKKIIKKSFYLRLKILGLILNILILFFLMAKFSQANEFVITLYEKAVFLFVILFYLNYNKFLILYFKDRQILEESVFQKSFRIYVRIIPWVFICCASLGLVGFNQLAWLIAFRLAIFLTFVLILFIGYGLLNDFRKILKIKAFKKYKLGAFVAQDIVSPIISIAKVAWTFATISLWVALPDWDSGDYYLTILLNIVNYNIIEVAGIKISITSVVLTVASIYLIMKVSRWFRSVSYRWLYARISDLGVRNSLSVFTQYFIVAAGFLVTLNIIGIDLTTLTVFAGALGVGIGLGLQDIAKNFISGILLLIERPLQTGDTVTINATDGTVKRIGMRSLTIETFDSEEVIIPNAAVISDAFTNWTYSNSILRSILYVGAGYASPPEKVIEVLTDIISRNEHILDNPAPKVILWEYADSSITYRFQYHIDLDKVGLFEVRTALLTEIWHQFKENGIEIPFPQRDLHVKSSGSMFS